MKKLINSMFVIIAAMVTFASCVKEEISAPESKTVHFIAESIETKTAFGTPEGTTYPTLWTENDKKVHISLNLTGSNEFNIVPAEDFKTATINAEFTDDLSGSYTFYSVSPASANKSFSKDYKTYNLEIPTTQTPTATSVDETAQILVASSQTYSAIPEVVNFAYKHLTAYGKMTLKNLNLNGATISSISLTASKNFAYRYYYYPETGELKENGSTQTITINTTSTSDVWFACAPVDMSNSTMDIMVTTNKGTFTKTVTFPADRKFESGKIAKFAVDMSGVALVSPVVYELVTDAAVLTPDSKVIIVGESYAMATNQKTNNRGAAGVTISNNTISSPSVDVQTFTIEEGTISGTVAFNTGSGYIYAASSSSNHLKTSTTKDDNASWLVTFAEEKTSIVAQGANTRNVMQFNPNNGSPMFACYASASQQPVSIYKLQGSGATLENYLNVSPSTINVKADDTSATFTVSSDLEWTATPSAGASVTTDGNVVTVTFAANTVEEEKVYTVTVSAEGVDPQTVTITQAKKITKTQLTVAEFKELSDGDDLYELTGEITGIYQAYNASYNNISFYLKDETGEVLIYRMSCDGIDYNKVIVGSIITVKGSKTTFSNQSQMAAGGICLSIVEATPVPIITFEENVVTITAVEDADIYFTIDGTEPTISDDDLYDEPYQLEETCTIKAIAVKKGLLQSAIVEKVCEYMAPGVQTNTIEVTFSEYSAGTQYAKNEEHVINDVLTLYTTECHFTSELRIYSSSTHNGYVVSNQLPGRITGMTFNAGNKVDNLVVYGSIDGSTWTEVGKVNVETTSYKDYSFSFGDTNYTYFKLDVEGSNQVRLKTLSVTYVE